MAGIKVTVSCATCGAPTRATTGVVALMATRGWPLRCLECRQARAREYMRVYNRRLNAELKNRKEGMPNA